eukprot:gene14778-16312_t
MVADESRTYGVTICKPEQYNNYSVTAHVNMPAGWRPIIGIMAQIDLCLDFECKKIIATNFPNKKFDGNHFVNSTFLASFKTLFVRTTAGRSNYIDWTVAVEFKKPGLKDPMLEKMREVDMEQVVGIKSPVPKSARSNSEVELLAQVVKTPSVETVSTLDFVEYLLYFCPDRQTTQRYLITIAATAVDSKSAMAMFVCTEPGVSCTVNTAIAYDPSGTGIATVTLHTGSATISEVRVLIVGYGDGQQINSFQLGATLKPEK